MGTKVAGLTGTKTLRPLPLLLTEGLRGWCGRPPMVAEIRSGQKERRR